MKRQWLDLTYDQETGFWMINHGDREYMIQRGTRFDLCLGKTSVPCVLEWDRKWIFVIGGRRFDLHPKEKYQVKSYRS